MFSVSLERGTYKTVDATTGILACTLHRHHTVGEHNPQTSTQRAKCSCGGSDTSTHWSFGLWVTQRQGGEERMKSSIYFSRFSPQRSATIHSTFFISRAFYLCCQLLSNPCALQTVYVCVCVFTALACLRSQQPMTWRMSKPCTIWSVLSSKMSQVLDWTQLA